MLINFLGKNRAQSTAEYAIVIGIVITAVIAIMPYVRRAWQGRVRGLTVDFVRCEETGVGFTDADVQYEYTGATVDFATNEVASSQEYVRGKAVNREAMDQWVNRAGSEAFEPPPSPY